MTSRTRRALPTLALLAVLAALAVTRPAGAHEGHHHQAMGTVGALEAARLVLDTTEGGARTFVLSAETRYLRGAQETKREDVAVGERAVVVYETKDGADRAVEVKLAEKKP